MPRMPAYLKKEWGVKPYEIWISLNENANGNDVAQFIDKYSMKVKRYVNKVDDVESTISDPLLQGTNGVLTLGFVVTIILCAVGYMIYWIMSIKERELVFGVLRACGFHKAEIVKMLVIEQFQNDKLKKVQSKNSYEDILKYNLGLVRFLISEEVLRDEDPEIMAAQLAWPVSMWTNLCDREPEREAEVMELVDRHIKQFFRVYRK